MGGGEFGDDLVEVQRGGVDLAGADRAVLEEFDRDEGTGVQGRPAMRRSGRGRAR